MLTYDEMQYFAAFARNGTLTEVAEQFHISQPTITRAMKKAEEVFGVPLFDRTKNSIHLNNNGRIAAEEIRLLLKQTDEMIERVQSYDRANRTITVGSAAAVQLPGLIGKLSSAFPEKTIMTELKLPDELIEGLDRNTYQLIVLPFDPAPENGDSYCSTVIGEEHLMFYLPENHPLAGRESLRLADLNGENMLLYSDIGFWAEIVRRKMPDSRFLVQNERYSLNELIVNSVLPCFITNLTLQESERNPDRVAVPITDEEVNVTYYLVYRNDMKKVFRRVFG